MLPDAGFHLKWTYGVEAFQQWSTQRNRPVLSASSEGKLSLFPPSHPPSFSRTLPSFRSGNPQAISRQIRSAVLHQRR